MTITLEEITKKYALKIVLNSITAEFTGGKIHAIVGENGAGKSTLAAILSGARQPTSGVLYVDGKETVLRSQRQAAQTGIIQVSQRPLLAESITVKENILLGYEYAKKSPRKQLLADLRTLQKMWAPKLDLNAYVRNIGGDHRFYTALLGALCRKPSVLILDEPSASLDWEQRRLLYADMRELARTGRTVIVITHSMEEAALYTDTVTVLEKGKLMAHYPNSKLFVPGVRGYRNFSIPQFAHPQNKEITDKTDFISFEDLTVRPKNRPALFDLSFTAQPGRITLIKGLQESGLGTLENVVTGMEQAPCSGQFTMQYAGKKTIRNLHRKKLSASVLRGKDCSRTGIIPSNRTFRGANPALTVSQILTVYYNGRLPDSYAEELIRKANIAIKPKESAANLSGGMLQRLILERELSGNPQFVIMCEPLQGLDSIAASGLCKRLYDISESGAVVLVLSATEFPTEICSSIYKLEGGKLSQVQKNRTTYGTSSDKKVADA